MEIRYLGFEQQQNSRSYRFEIIRKGMPPRRVAVMADLALFLAYHVGIQEGPSLSATKLTADLDKHVEGDHVLTSDDLRLYAQARRAAEAERAEARKGFRRRSGPSRSGTHDEHSPWRSLGLAKPGRP